MKFAADIATAYAPASVANLNCGYDLLGLAIEKPGDTVEIRRESGIGMRIAAIESRDSLPGDPDKNVATVAVSAMCRELGLSTDGLVFRMRKGNKVGSGLGSSAASAAAAVVALNGLLDEPLPKKDLVRFAMAGEAIASGAEHADNVAPSLLGGIVLISNYDPLRIVQLAYPDCLQVLVVHQEVEIRTAEARALLPESVPLQTTVRQMASLGGFVAGLAQSDMDLISDSLRDHIVEEHRSAAIPNFDEMGRICRTAGAVGYGISGSGPSVFALFDGAEQLPVLRTRLSEFLSGQQLNFHLHGGKINAEGARIIPQFETA